MRHPTNTQTKREIAEEILKEMFQDEDRIAIADARKAVARHGVSARTLARAASDLGVVEIHNGPYGAFWAIASQ